MAYDLPYMEYDEFGIVRVRCMACNEPIIERAYTTVVNQSDPTKMEKVIAWKRLSNHCEASVRLSDGSITGFPCCTTCRDLPIDAVKSNSLRLAEARREMKVLGKDDDFIDAVMTAQGAVEVAMKEEHFKKLSANEQSVEIAKAKKRVI